MCVCVNHSFQFSLTIEIIAFSQRDGAAGAVGGSYVTGLNLNANATAGNNVITAINAGSTTIDAARLDLASATLAGQVTGSLGATTIATTAA